MATIKYNGMELEELNPDKSVSFNPPIKCVGWNNEGVKVEFELSSALSKEIWIHRFIGKTKGDTPVAFRFCALLPEKPAPRRATNRELAKWLAQGMGEVTEGIEDSRGEGPYCSSKLYYSASKSNEVVENHIRVRNWDDTEWHDPDVEYMKIEEA